MAGAAAIVRAFGTDGLTREQAWTFRLTAALLALSLLAGGGNGNYPVAEGVVEVAAIALLARLLWQPSAASSRPGRALAIFALAVVAIPLAQLVPLPPGIWRILPGHALAVEGSDATGLGGMWRPLSLVPDATRRDVLALLPPLAMLFAALRSRSEQRLALLRLVIAIGLLSLVVGALQFASGGGAFMFYETAHRGYPVGFFINRNHQATLLLCCIVITGIPRVLTGPARRRDAERERLLPSALILLFAIGVIATSSRMGASLLPLALGFGLIPLWWSQPDRRLVLLASPVLIAVGIVIYNSFIAQRVIGRLDASENDRWIFWTTLMPALRRGLPWGTGVGSFVPIFQTVEPLETLSPLYVNHAHNDYLELLLEAGVPAAVMVALFLGLVGWSIVALFRSRASRRSRAIGVAGVGVLLVMLLHSTVDYPLRTSALAVVAALMAAGLSGSPMRGGGPRRRGPMRMAGLTVVMLAAVFAGWQAVSATWADHARRQGDPILATRLAPWMAAPLADAAALRWAAHDPSGAADLARRSLRIEPLQVTALRILTQASEREGQAPSPVGAVVAKAGWRDAATQMWLLDRAVRQDDAPVAIQRADAMLRQDLLHDVVFRTLQMVQIDPDYQAALVARLASRPPWRVGYLRKSASLPADGEDAAYAVLAGLARTAAPPTPEERGPFARRLIEEGDLDRAYALEMRGSAAPALQNGTFDDGPDALLQAGDPFAWEAPHMLGVTISSGMPPVAHRGDALLAETDGVATGVVLRQLMVLAPGSYRLSAAWLGQAAGADTGASWDIRCIEDDQPRATLTDDVRGEGSWAARAVGFTVPEGGCPAVRVELRLDVRAGQAMSVWTDDVAVSRVASSPAVQPGQADKISRP